MDINNSWKIAVGKLQINKSLGSGNTIDITFQPPITFTKLYTTSMGHSSSNSSYCYNCVYSSGHVVGKIKNDSGGNETITYVDFVLVGF